MLSNIINAANFLIKNKDKIPDIGRSLLNVVQSIVGAWLDPSDQIGEWTRRHSTEEIADMTNKINKIKALRSSSIDNLQRNLEDLNSLGFNFVLPPKAAEELANKKRQLKSQVDNALADDSIASANENLLLESYNEKGKLGDYVFGEKRNSNNSTKENMYKEVINNVQEKFGKEEKI